MRHLFEGGTAVTNIQACNVADTEEALRRYGMADLVLHDKAYGGGADQPGWKSLHWLGPWSRDSMDLSTFWKIAAKVKAERQWQEIVLAEKI